MIRGRFLTAANMVSIARIPLTATAAIMLWNGLRFETLVFMAIATATDAIDGALARKTGTVSDWGKILDPAADKISFLIMAFTLVYLGHIPAWILWLLLGRDGLIALGGLIISRRMKPPTANFLGKLTTCVLAVYMIRQAVFPGGEIFLGTSVLGITAALLIVVSFVFYIFIFIRSNWKMNAT